MLAPGPPPANPGPVKLDGGDSIEVQTHAGYSIAFNMFYTL